MPSSSSGVRLRLSRNAIEKIFGSKIVCVSKGIDKVLEKYSEKVNEDVLEEFLKERR
ncbi:MAG: hypothetical protein GSR79_09740 [Desulfurococcales archaeon]|nr:hypothetical protein [Desulfurococcales archaeon]